MCRNINSKRKFSCIHVVILQESGTYTIVTAKVSQEYHGTHREAGYKKSYKMRAQWPACTNTSLWSVNLFSWNIDLVFDGLDFGFIINKNQLPYKNGKCSLYGVVRINYIIWTNSNYWKTVSFWFSQHNNVWDIIFKIDVAFLDKTK